MATVPIETTFVLTRDEFRKAARTTLRNLPLKLRLVGWLQCGLLVVLMLLPIAYRPDGELRSFNLVLVAFVWMIFLTGQIVSQGVLGWQYQRIDGKEIRYQFDESGFRSSMADGETHINWSGINRYLETDALLVLTSGSLFYTIPKRALSVDDLQSLKSLLIAKLPLR